MPKGFSEEGPHSEYLRLRTFEMYKSLSKRDVLAKDFLPKALAALKRCRDFNEMLNQCFDYAYD